MSIKKKNKFRNNIRLIDLLIDWFIDWLIDCLFDVICPISNNVDISKTKSSLQLYIVWRFSRYTTSQK
jgi:hypothetical protein